MGGAVGKVGGAARKGEKRGPAETPAPLHFSALSACVFALLVNEGGKALRFQPLVALTLSDGAAVPNR